MKRRDILTLLVPSLIIVILWVIFSVYHNFIGSTIPTSVNDQISAITPSFDIKTIEAIKGRDTVNPIYVASPQSSGNQELTPETSDTTNPISSSSANVASQGGVLNQ